MTIRIKRDVFVERLNATWKTYQALSYEAKVAIGTISNALSCGCRLTSVEAIGRTLGMQDWRDLIRDEDRAAAGLAQVIGPVEPTLSPIEVKGDGRQIRKVLDGYVHQDFNPFPATNADIPVLYERFRYHFGDNAPKLEMMFEWNQRQPAQLFKVVRSRSEGGRTQDTIVGAFKVLRANQEAAALLDVERLTGTGFTWEHFARPGDTPYAIYIGDVYGDDDGISRGHVMHWLIICLREYIDAGVRFFYSRPLTLLGLSWTVHNSFIAVNPEFHGLPDHIYKRDNTVGGPFRNRAGRVFTTVLPDANQ